MTSIPLWENDITDIWVRDMGVWEAMDAYQAGFVAASAEELAGAGGAAYHVRQAALETVIAEQMRLYAVISIHRALLAGAAVGEVAHALGCSHTDIAARWRSWVEGQLRLNVQCPGLGVDRHEYERVAAAFRADLGAAGVDTQIGSPRL